VRSALALFALRGFAGTSIRMIAGEAGVSQGLLYNYFDGKSALLRAIFARGMEDVQSTFVEAERATTAAAGVASLVRAAFATVRAHADFWALSYQVRMQPEVLADLGDDLGGWTDAIVARIESLYDAAGESGAGARARALFAAIDGAAQHWVLDPDGYPLDAVGAEIVRLFAPAPERGRTTRRMT
jgi:AcrR family transcriptional regulator